MVGPGGTTGEAGPGGAEEGEPGFDATADCESSPPAPEAQSAFCVPAWFAQGQEELFYGRPTDNSGGLLPSYRTHPRMRTIDVVGMRESLAHVLEWPLTGAVCCHTDPIRGGAQAKALLRRAWGWLWLD